MSESKSVWAVLRCYYEETEIIGVYQSEQNAERVRDFINKNAKLDLVAVKKFRLDDYISELDSGMRKFEVLFYPSGMLKSIKDILSTGQIITMPESIVERHDKSEMACEVWAKDYQSAEAVAKEKFIEFKEVNG